MKIRHYLAAALVLSFVLSACSSSADEKMSLEDLIQLAEEEGASSATMRRIEDGVVTPAEREAAIADYRTCLGDLGIIAGEPLVNPVDGWRVTIDLDMRGDDSPELAESADNCAGEFYGGAIQLGYEMSNPEVMDPLLMAATQKCLADQGVETTGQETNIDDLGRGEHLESDRVQLVLECIRTHAWALYPDRRITLTY